MEDLQLLINVYARFLDKHSSAPVEGDYLKVRIFDKDLLSDDFLEEGLLNEEGKVHLTFNPLKFKGGDSPGETKPDLYIVLLKGEKEIFRTPVLKDINLNAVGNFDIARGEWIDMGTFLI